MRAAVGDQRSAVSSQALTFVDVDDAAVTRRGVAGWLRLVALLIVNALVGLLWLAIIGWLVGRICTDRFAWSQWLWWIPTPAALIAAVLGWLFAFRAAHTRRRRRWRIAIWTACTFALAFSFCIIEHRLLHAAPDMPTSGVLTIAHWNMTLDNNADVPKLLRGVETLDSDIMLFTSPPGMVRDAVVTAVPAGSTGDQRHIINAWPVLIQSGLPVIRSQLLVATDGVFITLVEIDATERIGRSIVLYSVDLPSNPRRPRMQIARQARRMLDDVHAPTPDLVAGDFNMTRDSASIATLFPGMIDAYNEAGHGYGATFPRRLPLYQIDHVLVNEAAGLRAARYDIFDLGISRHQAQKAWITRP